MTDEKFQRAIEIQNKMTTVNGKLSHVMHGRFDVVINGHYQEESEKELVVLSKEVFREGLEERLNELKREFDKI